MCGFPSVEALRHMARAPGEQLTADSEGGETSMTFTAPRNPMDGLSHRSGRTACHRPWGPLRHKAGERTGGMCH